MKEPNILMPPKRFIKTEKQPIGLSDLIDEEEMIESLIRRIGIRAFIVSMARTCAKLEKEGRLK